MLADLRRRITARLNASEPLPAAPAPPAGPTGPTPAEELRARLLAADPGLVEAAADGVTVLARPALTLSGYPELVRANLDLVMDAAAAAGVDAGLVDQPDPGRQVVAVRAPDRVALLAELARRHAGDAVYLCPLPPSTPGGKARIEHVPARRRVKPVPVLAGVADPQAWPDHVLAPALRVYRAYAGPAGRAAIGGQAGCEIEWWDADETGRWLAPRPNRRVSELPRWQVAATGRVGDRDYPALVDSSDPLDLDVGFPIDLVYTWVDGGDPAFRAQRSRHADAEGRDDVHHSALTEARWRDREELRHSLRSAQMHADWIRNIWIVTAGQTPAWLDTADPRIRVVDHREIFADPTVLPTFNSHAIESQLHHINGLAEHYLYSNDDLFFGRPVRPEQYFLGNGLARVFRTTSKIEAGPRQPEDRPVMAAHKNGRELFQRDFGVTVTHRLKHTVFPQRRSVLYELEERYPEEFARTMRARFRSPADISVASSFGPYYLLLTGRAYVAPLSYGYVESGRAHLGETLESWLASRALEAICINDGGLDPDELPADEQHRLITDFLTEYFPWPSRHERPATVVLPRPRETAEASVGAVGGGWPSA